MFNLKKKKDLHHYKKSNEIKFYNTLALFDHI